MASDIGVLDMWRHQSNATLSKDAELAADTGKNQELFIRRKHGSPLDAFRPARFGRLAQRYGRAIRSTIGADETQRPGKPQCEIAADRRYTDAGDCFRDSRENRRLILVRGPALKLAAVVAGDDMRRIEPRGRGKTPGQGSGQHEMTAAGSADKLDLDLPMPL
ncbi:MAG TPA: hypothetical protein VJQ81_16170 [Reyranella sp.]|nr:hypothetical protein [Reyranella sp.]